MTPTKPSVLPTSSTPKVVKEVAPARVDEEKASQKRLTFDDLIEAAQHEAAEDIAKENVDEKGSDKVEEKAEEKGEDKVDKEDKEDQKRPGLRGRPKKTSEKAPRKVCPFLNSYDSLSYLPDLRTRFIDPRHRHGQQC